jgi:serine/threonine protein kinase
LHRDIKPANLVLSKRNNLIMVDFGTSKVFENNEDILTGKDFTAGTEEFRAPERCDRFTANR